MKVLIKMSLFLLALFSVSASAERIYEIKDLKVLEVNSSINPATLNYLDSSLKSLKAARNQAAVIKLDTPGGLVTTTKSIITLIGSLEVPVFIWITPEGASATSAGAIIASAAHLLFMSEGTNIGAATPVGLGNDIKESDGRSKAINDLVALVTSLAKARGRNAALFEKMISEAKSFDAEIALKEKIIDGIANNMADINDGIDGKTIRLKGESITLKTTNLMQVNDISMDAGQSILNIFANPMTAYILFIIGAALLYFEFQAPGGMIAGSVGVVCLILAAIGFQILPLNFGALGLIILSFILFILEAYITSYGILSIAGVASLIFGSLFLFRTQDSYLELQLSVIISSVAAIIIYLFVVGFVIYRGRKKTQPFFEVTNEIGIISNIINSADGINKYQVRVAGEIWNAFSGDDYTIGEKVAVIEQNNNEMKITINKL
jgi:membrane-bound serine protease (ClpP class)